jgi:hypothetical protein
MQAFHQILRTAGGSGDGVADGRGHGGGREDLRASGPRTSDLGRNASAPRSRDERDHRRDSCTSSASRSALRPRSRYLLGPRGCASNSPRKPTASV